MGDRWKREKEVELDQVANQSRLAGRLTKIRSTLAGAFGIAVLRVGVLLFTVTAVATRNPDGNCVLFYTVSLGGYFLHAFLQ